MRVPIGFNEGGFFSAARRWAIPLKGCGHSKGG